MIFLTRTSDRVRQVIPRFLEVHLDCPVETLVARDVKGLYKRAFAGDVPNFTGISDPYEPPLAPDLYLNTSKQSVEECAAAIIAKLHSFDWVHPFEPSRSLLQM